MRERMAGGLDVAAGERPAAQDRLGDPHVERVRRRRGRDHAGRPARAHRDGRDPGERDVHRGDVAVVLADAPVVRDPAARASARSRPSSSPRRAGGAVILLAGARAAVVAPLLYCVFLLTNSTAAASLGGARAAEVEHDHQGMLNLFVGTLGLAGFLVGVLLVGRAARPARLRRSSSRSSESGWRRRRSRSAGRSSPRSRARPPDPRRHRLPGRRAAVRGRRRRATAGTIDLVHDGSRRIRLRPRRARSSTRDGLMLCPGFIDLHTHSALRSFEDPFLTPKLAQGFTTEVINPDGLAPAPVAPGPAGRAAGVPAAARGRRAGDVAVVDGGGVPRRARRDASRALARPLDRPRRRARPRARRRPRRRHGRADLRAMRREVRLGLDAGARMLSFGLVYLPGAYAATDELVAVAEEAAAVGRAARPPRAQRGPRPAGRRSGR